jgi:hypothetical protein
VQLKVAKLDDIDGVIKLQHKYHVDSIDEKNKADGFVTTAFTKQQLSTLVTKEQGLFIGVKNKKVVAYVMAASWQYWSQWPLFAYMIKRLHKVEYLSQTLNTSNSYQYGPVCLDTDIRGSGALEDIFDFARNEMSKKYLILVTFINVTNTRSYVAHTKKLGLEVLNKFEFNQNQYYQLVYDTQIPI